MGVSGGSESETGCHGDGDLDPAAGIPSYYSGGKTGLSGLYSWCRLIGILCSVLHAGTCTAVMAIVSSALGYCKSHFLNSPLF